jgi:protein SCO1/2
VNRPCLIAGLFLLAAAAVHGAERGLGPAVFDRVGIDQRLDAAVPRGLTFTDAAGARVELDPLMASGPVLLALVYHRCPNVCGLNVAGLIDALNELELRSGRDFSVIVASIDPEEGPAEAAKAKSEALKRYEGTAVGWHFLTGPAVAALADAVGFRYAYDAAIDQYAHPAASLLLTPDGRISAYLYGLRPDPNDLRLGLLQAGGGRSGSIMDRVLLLCYRYDPETGRYTNRVMGALQVGGVLTVLGMAGFAGRSLLRERRGGSGRPRR